MNKLNMNKVKIVINGVVHFVDREKAEATERYLNELPKPNLPDIIDDFFVPINFNGKVPDLPIFHVPYIPFDKLKT